MWSRPLPVVLLAATVLPAAGATEQTVALDPARTRIAFRLGATAHDVEGEFALRSGEVRFDPETGEAVGRIEVDLTGASTGSKKRDRTMHERVLESERFPLASFRPTRVASAVLPEGDSTVAVEGVLAFHGSEHPMTLEARVTRAGPQLTVDVRFDIPYVEWGLEDPSFLFLRVKKAVQVHVTGEGTIR